MKKLFSIAVAAIVCFGASAQVQTPAQEQEDGFKFETVKELPITKVQDQASTGTCWCFSATSFLESEMIRNGYKAEDLNLSEMFTVYNAYVDKAVKYVRVDGALNFAQGSSFGDVVITMKKYGAVPESVMPGLNYGTTRHAHSELAKGLKGFVSAIASVPNKKLTTAWIPAFKGILNAYLGEAPSTFTYNGKEYTPKSYLESLPINLDDYVQLTSWTHLSYYEKHPVEVADNWRWEEAFNVPLDEFVAIIDNAINNGYTVAWASDVSEQGFTRDGVALVPDVEAVNAEGSDQARWLGKTTPTGKFNLTGPVTELKIDAAMRQEGYENKTTTDDHGMHIFGIAKDCKGNKYYMVKNSWGTSSKYKGIWYVSEAFVRYKTMDLMVHKNALPKELKKKLNIK